VAVLALAQVSVTVVCVAMVAPLAGKLFVVQPGTGMEAVVKVVALVRSQPVAEPVAFLGTMYQLYSVAALRPVALYDVPEETLAIGVVGAVTPVQRYTSYEVALVTAPHVSVAVVCVPMVASLAGKLFTAQTGTGTDAVVKVDLLFTSQPTAGPVAFFGTTYQL